jgi:hypothetical protein
MLDDEEHRFNCSLPLRELLFGPGKLLDIFRGVLKGEKLPASGQRDWIVERALPTLGCFTRSAPTCVKER